MRKEYVEWFQYRYVPQLSATGDKHSQHTVAVAVVVAVDDGVHFVVVVAAGFTLQHFKLLLKC